MKVLEKTKAFLEQHQLNHQLMETPANMDIPAPDWKAFQKMILVGGDGSLHRVLNYWGVPEIPICLISGGSGNDFSRLSHQSASLNTQLQSILSDTSYACDLGRCNGIYFATGVGIGFDGEVGRILQNNSRFKGHLAYFLVVIMQIFRYREKPIRMDIDGVRKEGPSLLLTVGNGSEFGGGFKVTPGASFTDGIFQCCLIEKVGLLQRILHLPKVEKGKHEQLPFVHMFDCTTIRITADETLTCHMDGEIYQWEDFRIEMLPAAMQLLA